MVSLRSKAVLKFSTMGAGVLFATMNGTTMMPGSQRLNYQSIFGKITNCMLYMYVCVSTDRVNDHWHCLIVSTLNILHMFSLASLAVNAVSF